jgi:hypothetical protein
VASYYHQYTRSSRSCYILSKHRQILLLDYPSSPNQIVKADPIYRPAASKKIHSLLWEWYQKPLSGALVIHATIRVALGRPALLLPSWPGQHFWGDWRLDRSL